MKLAAGQHTITFTPIEAPPKEPGRYLAIVPRPSYAHDGPAFSVVCVAWVRDGRSGNLSPEDNHPGAIWTHMVRVFDAAQPGARIVSTQRP